MDERTIQTSSFTDSRISLFSFFSYHFSTKTKPLMCVPPNPPALWIVTIFRASLSFIPPEILHLDQNHRTGTLGRMPVTSTDWCVCVCIQYQSLCIQWPGIAITPAFKTSLLFDPLGHLINMDPFRIIRVQRTFLKLYSQKTLSTYESINL